MWAILMPAASIPLFVSLWDAERRAKKKGLLDDIPSPWRSFGKKALAMDLFWQTDVIGLFLLAATLTLVLLPLTLYVSSCYCLPGSSLTGILRSAGGETTQWHEARIIVMLVIGFVVCLPSFVYYEWKMAKHPIIPFKLLRNRTIIAGLVIAMFLNASWYLQGDYLYAIMIVAFNQSPLSATRISNIYSFASVCECGQQKRPLQY